MDDLIARPSFNRSSKKWNVFINKDGNDIPVGTTVGKLLDKPLFKTTEFNNEQDAISWINKSPFKLKEVKKCLK